MNHSPRLRIIFPTEELFDEYAPSENLLRMVHTTLKDTIVYVVDYWLRQQEPWEPPPEGNPIYTLFAYMDTDFLGDLRYVQYESQDLQAIRYVLHRIGLSVYLSIMPILDVHRLPDSVQQNLRVEGWMGKSLVLSTVTAHLRYGHP